MTPFEFDRAETAEHMSDAVTYLQRVALRAGFDGIAADLGTIAHRLKDLADDKTARPEGHENKH